MRVGLGFDAHPLVPQRALVLGGVSIPSDLGLAGHSDGDVLTHAIMDALLGAASLGDKGSHFPSSDPQYRNISSLVLLARTAQLVQDGRWRVVNLDATILAQRPMLAPYVESMKQSISDTLSIPKGDVGIKATTTDSLGFVGRSEGMAAFAVALVEGMA